MKILRISFLSLIVLAWSSSHAQTGKKMENALTPAEKKGGWTLLFDGKSLNGWRIYKNGPNSSWKVANGTLYSSGNVNQGDLLTNDQFENFELALDWKIAPQGNSGIMYHVTEQYDQPYMSGPEYQLVDDKGFPEKLEDWQHTGANYAMNPPSALAAKPVGEWNHTRIVVNNGHVEHWLNGVKVVDYQLGSDEWKKNKEAGKWKNAPGYGMSQTGHIALQSNHAKSDGVWFKNIKLKQL